MASVPTGAVPPANELPPKPEDSEVKVTTAETPAVNWESEVQLVSSLAKLQELERRIHELRQCIPAGLLEPLAPISSSQKSSADRIPSSPPTIHHGLETAARSGLARVEEFQNLWRSPDLKPMWEHVQTRVKESNGQLVQPTGMWEKDYGSLLEDLLKTEKNAEEDRLREEEDAERAKALSSEGEWQAVLERFSARNIPGVQIIRGNDQNKADFVIVLPRAGLVFMLEGAREPDSPGVASWQVSNKAPSGRPPTKLELSVLECIGSRPRKWDLAFLLDMISSYAEIKQIPCIKCTKLTNNAAQLPVVRRVQSLHKSDDPTQPFVFNAYHSTCL